MTALLAQMWRDGGGDHMDSGWWWVMGIGFLILLAALVGVVALLLSRHSPPTSATADRGPEEILAQRYARGEIDDEEYRRRREALRE